MNFNLPIEQLVKRADTLKLFPARAVASRRRKLKAKLFSLKL